MRSVINLSPKAIRNNIKDDANNNISVINLSPKAIRNDVDMDMIVAVV